ncbi:uncharacterized protein LOC123503051 [Portunus trituberculatus]|uniref:uncharacterized protein LOC123503051 n=1 Tax=Portunus trituberculatus TaxID=210409 RepID=UPI001E1CDC04|nr:uncharacterized protein LOC123503051 [Portunus trituberculatus]
MDKRSVLLLVVVVVVVALAGSVGAACPSNQLLPYGACVKLINMVETGDNRQNWEKSNEICVKEGGQMISLDTPTKLEQFAAHVYNLPGDWSSYAHWVGARKTGSSWSWLNDAELPINSNIWYPTAPEDNANETYGFLAPYRDHQRFYLYSTDANGVFPVIACEIEEY